jgi:hypothetical protein
MAKKGEAGAIEMSSNKRAVRADDLFDDNFDEGNENGANGQ